MGTLIAPGPWIPPQFPHSLQQQMSPASAQLHFNIFEINCAAAGSEALPTHFNPSRCALYLHWHHSHQCASFASEQGSSDFVELENFSTGFALVSSQPKTHLVYVHVWLFHVYCCLLSHVSRATYSSTANNLITIRSVSTLKLHYVPYVNMMLSYCCHLNSRIRDYKQ